MATLVSATWRDHDGTLRNAYIPDLKTREEVNDAMVKLKLRAQYQTPEITLRIMDDITSRVTHVWLVSTTEMEIE